MRPKANKTPTLPPAQTVDTEDPVSYTHLDVYKRQELSCIIQGGIMSSSKKQPEKPQNRYADELKSETRIVIGIFVLGVAAICARYAGWIS